MSEVWSGGVVANAVDVGAFILELTGGMTAMKLQKLLYYSQAWSLVWEEAPLFPDTIEAWINGPVVPGLFSKFQGKFYILPGDFPAGLGGENLTETERDNVRKVLDFYGEKNPQWLSDLTHMEKPWQDARTGLAGNERGSHEIPCASMAEYYGSLA